MRGSASWCQLPRYRLGGDVSRQDFRTQRNFEPMRRQLEGGRQIQLTDARAKPIDAP